MKVRFWGILEDKFGLTVEAENTKEQKNLAKILEGLKKSHIISAELGGKAYKGCISSWHEDRKGLFTKVTKFIEMNFWPAER